jgi:Holliday junction resolvasome RuvABC DNA-binding subunit
MAIGGISQTGIDTNLINQKMNKGSLQTQPEPNKEKDDPIVGTTETVNFTANVSERLAIEFEAIDEEQANILAQLVANDLSKQSFGISTPAGTDVFRTFM